MGAQKPYPISGTVTLNGTAVNGARLWAQDTTEGTFTHKETDVSYVETNSSGQYLIDVANITSAYANADTVRVYCTAKGIETYADVTLNTTTGVSTQNFALTSRGPVAGVMKDGIDKLGSSMKKGTKDGLS